MAVTAVSDVAVAGHGTQSQVAYESVGRVEPTIFRFMPLIELGQGWPSHTFPTWGAGIDAAATTESQAALTPQSLGTLGSLALTPSGVRASMGGSSEAFLRVLPENDLLSRYTMEIKNAMARYFAYDSSVGVTKYQFTQVSASGGSGTATVSGILDVALARRAALGDASVHLIAWLDDAGINQIDDDIRSGGATSLGGAAMQDEIAEILYKNGFEAGRSGYHYTVAGSVHIFKDPNPSALAQSAPNRVGCVFVPHLPGLNGIPLQSDKPQPLTANLAPAFGMAFRSDPVIAAKIGCPTGQVVYGEDEAGRYAIIPRSYAGINQGIVDGWRMGAVGIINQASAARFLYTI